MEELLGTVLLRKSGAGEVTETSTAEALNGKTVGLYFSASWCPPCQKFTPVLVECYAKLAQEQKPFEIVFISSDRAIDPFTEYWGRMPWLALPFSRRDQAAELKAKFGVPSIPYFVILGADGAVLTTNGRKAVSADPAGTKFPWKEDGASCVIG